MSQPNELTQQVFKYEQLDESTSDFLRTKETNMRDIVGKAYTELGRELYEAQQELAGSRYDGVFEKWYTALGFSKRSVYNYIGYFTEVQQLHTEEEVELFESLPLTLSYAISAPSAETTPEKAQAKAEVLAGDIGTNKAYQDRIAELEEDKEAMRKSLVDELTTLEYDRIAERKERERLEVEVSGLHETNVELAEKADKPAEIKLEYVEVEKEAQGNGDYKEIRKERDELKSDNRQLEKSLTDTYGRIERLEKLERTVKAQEDSPMYDLIRSLQTTNRYFDTFDVNSRFTETAIASAEQTTVDSLEKQIRRSIAKAEQVSSLIDNRNGVVIIDQSSTTDYTDFTEIQTIEIGEDY